MSPDYLQTSTLKEIVSQNFQTAAIFEKYSLDFCCRGGVTIEQACKDKGIAPSVIFDELSKISGTESVEVSRFAQWAPEFLVDYIVSNHHAYVAAAIPVIRAHTQKVAAVHGANHPEVIKIAEAFERVADDLLQHMRVEEQILFPYIKQLIAAKEGNVPVDRSPFGSVRNPVRMMEMEHQAAGDEMYNIRSLTGGYVPPEDACTTYRISFKELQEFERDLHQHVHLENNLLFPKAVLLEDELLARG